MKVAIRADASTLIGAGHVMRCLTLAGELTAGGGQVVFLCRDLPGNLNEVIAARGFEVHVLLGGRGAWDESLDAEACLGVLTQPVDWLVVDHYALSKGWEQTLRSKTSRILVIDDLADRPHDCDLLLDQNLLPQGRYAGLVPEACKLLLGPRYALLRPQFLSARGKSPRQAGEVHRLLVSYGGGDAGGETLKALQAIAVLGKADLAVDVVIGLGNPHYQAVDAACSQLQGCELYYQVEDMASLMVTADLALGAGGGTALERCCLGLPSMVSALADNQVAPARGLAEAGCQVYLGWAEALQVEDYVRYLTSLLSLPELLCHLGRQSMDLVDGRGVHRVARELLAHDLQLRLAREEDAANLYLWRNHPDNRRYAFNTEPIAMDEHLRWFARVQEDNDRWLLIAEEGGMPVGVLRYDLAGTMATVSIYLMPGLGGRGYGGRLLSAGEAWLERQHPEIRGIRAEVRPDNVASARAFLAAGYRHVQSVYAKDIHRHA